MNRHAPIGPTFALTVCAVVAAFGVLAPLAHWAIEPTVLPPPFPVQNQDAETLLFISIFLIVLPASLLFVPRLADRMAGGPGGQSFGALAAIASIALLGSLVFVKVSERLPWGTGLWLLFGVSLLWLASCAVLVAASGSRRVLSLSFDSPTWKRTTWIVAGTLGAVLALSFARIGSIAPLPLAAGVVLAVGVAAFGIRELPRPSRPLGIALDVGAVALLLLVVLNLVVFSPEEADAGAETTIIQFHQNFFLGPANSVLGGEAMLVDTLSQYGVGSIYFLAAWFQLAPIGNGTLALIEGLLSGAVFAVAYLVLRMAGVGRLLAAGSMAVAVVVLVLNLIYPVGALLQHGAIRFGLPIAVIAAAVLEARSPGRAVAARTVQLGAVAIASIWALEAFAYTLLTVAGVTLFELATRAGPRWRWLLGRIGQVASACVAAHLLFAAITLAAAGQLPDWGFYLETLREFLVGGIGDLTYDFTPWSTALAVAALYVSSVVAIVLTVLRRPDLVEERRVALVALSGSTAYGIALFSYFVNRSADHILPYIALPAVMVVTLWLSLLLRSSPSLSLADGVRRFALAGTLGVAALLIAVAWSAAGERFSQSALAHAAPGGRSLSGALDRLWEPPELARGADEGARLVERYMPRERTSLLLTSADLGIEILMETGRINTIPLSDPWEDSLVPDQRIDELNEAVDELMPGERALLDPSARMVFRAYERDPESGIISVPTLVPSGIAPLQEVALRRIATRFRFETIVRGRDGMSIVELVPRSSSG